MHPNPGAKRQPAVRNKWAHETDRTPACRPRNPPPHTWSYKERERQFATPHQPSQPTSPPPMPSHTTTTPATMPPTKRTDHSYEREANAAQPGHRNDNDPAHMDDRRQREQDRKHRKSSVDTHPTGGPRGHLYPGQGGGVPPPASSCVYPPVSSFAATTRTAGSLPHTLQQPYLHLS